MNLGVENAFKIYCEQQKVSLTRSIDRQMENIKIRLKYIV
jgi:hypothetical protein